MKTKLRNKMGDNLLDDCLFLLSGIFSLKLMAFELFILHLIHEFKPYRVT